MSTLYITEYSQISPQGAARGSAQAPQEQPIVEQTVSFSGPAVLSSAFNAKTRLVRLHADHTCSVLFGGAGVVATTGSQRLVAGVTEFHGLADGGSGVTNLSVITNS